MDLVLDPNVVPLNALDVGWWAIRNDGSGFLHGWIDSIDYDGDEIRVHADEAIQLGHGMAVVIPDEWIKQ